MSTAELVRGDLAAWETLRGSHAARAANVRNADSAGPLLDGLALPVRPARRDGEAVIDLSDGACAAAGATYATYARGARDQRDVIGPLRHLCLQCPLRRSCLRAGRRTHGDGLAGGVVLVGGIVAPGGTAGDPAVMTAEPDHAPVKAPARPPRRDIATRRRQVLAARQAGRSNQTIATALGVDPSTVGNDIAALRRDGHLPPSGSASNVGVEQASPSAPAGSNGDSSGQTPAAAAQQPGLVGSQAPAAPARPRRKLTRAQRRRQRGTYWRARRQRARVSYCPPPSDRQCLNKARMFAAQPLPIPSVTNPGPVSTFHVVSSAPKST